MSVQSVQVSANLFAVQSMKVCDLLAPGVFLPSRQVFALSGPCSMCWPVDRIRNRLGSPYYRLVHIRRLGVQPCPIGWLNQFNAEQWQLHAFCLLACHYFAIARLGGAVRTPDCNLPIVSPILSTGQIWGFAIL